MRRNYPLGFAFLSVAISASLLVLVSVARAQFVAFNDHYSGPATHPNATTWNVWGTTAGAPGSSGPLKDIATGAMSSD